ncbi:MAG: PKD domain-containing protein [Halobacteria archaeon]
METDRKYLVLAAVVLAALVSLSIAVNVDDRASPSATPEDSNSTGTHEDQVRETGERNGKQVDGEVNSDSRVAYGNADELNGGEDVANGSVANSKVADVSNGSVANPKVDKGKMNGSRADDRDPNKGGPVHINVSETVVEEDEVVVFTVDKPWNVSVEEVDWYFGDGGNGSGMLTAHSFTEPGNHTVKLMAYGNGGRVHWDKTRMTIEKYDPYPALKKKYESVPDSYARISSTNYTPVSGQEVKLRIVPLGHRRVVFNVEWKFLNTSDKTRGATAVKTFEEPGVQVVRATGETRLGNRFEDTVVLDVRKP